MNLASGCGAENQMEAHRSSGEHEFVFREAYDTAIVAMGGEVFCCTCFHWMS